MGNSIIQLVGNGVYIVTNSSRWYAVIQTVVGMVCSGRDDVEMVYTVVCTVVGMVCSGRDDVEMVCTVVGIACSGRDVVLG